MEYAKTEIEQLETTVSDAAETQMRELNELQLTIVGGGQGEVSFQ